MSVLMACFRTIFIILLVCLAGRAYAADGPAPLIKIVKAFTLHLPLDCTIGKDCWVLNYPDTGPENDDKASDPACGEQTYDGHKGTDIAISDKEAMHKGVNVFAAHDGVVTRVRDSEDDHFPLSDEQLANIKADKKECGNAVLVDHGDGWQTMYCHLKRGSVTVTPQQQVKAGDKIAQVGASGMTQFPHLHLGVIHNTDVIDPFTGRSLTEACGLRGGKSLFEKAAGIAYQPLTFAKLGFYDGPVDLDALDLQPLRAELSTDSGALVFYAVMLGLRKDDVIEMRIMQPDGNIFVQRRIVQDKARARQLLYVGRKAPQGEKLLQGAYEGKVSITRKDSDGKDLLFKDTRSINLAR